MSKQLTTTVSITEEALDVLRNLSRISGHPMGYLVSQAVMDRYDPKRNKNMKALATKFADDLLHV